MPREARRILAKPQQERRRKPHLALASLLIENI
jgi:hypothetical protein